MKTYSSIIYSLLAAGAMLTGCSHKGSKAAAPKPADANPIDPTAAPAVQEKARLAQAVAFRSGVEPPEPTLKIRGGEPASPEVIAAYNQELARAIFFRREAPETLEELVRKWPLPRLPIPPAGKQIAYDPVNRVIRLDPP